MSPEDTRTAEAILTKIQNEMANEIERHTGINPDATGPSMSDQDRVEAIVAYVAVKLAASVGVRL